MSGLVHSGLTASIPTEQADKPAGHWTPGNWRAAENASGFTVRAPMELPAAWGSRRSWLAVCVCPKPYRRAQDNARLIAASPALFDALLGLLNSVWPDGWPNSPSPEMDQDVLAAVLMARAAIAKATGAAS